MATPIITPQIRQQQAMLAALPRPTVAPMANMAASVPDFGPAPTPSVNIVGAPTQAMQNVAARDVLLQHGSGVDNIKNPWLRGFARVGDIALGTIAPHIESMIPGTVGNHNYELAKANAQIGVDQAQAEHDANLEHIKAATRLANDNATAAETPAGPEYDYKDTDNGTVAIQKGTTNATAVLGPDGKQIAAPHKDKPIEEQAYESLIAAGVHPEEAINRIYGAKNQKSDNPTQQYIDALQSGDMGKAQLIKRAIYDTQTQPKVTVINARESQSGAGGGGASAAAATPGADGTPSPLVQAIIDGRAPAPSPRSKAGAALLSAVTAADPTYDASRYQTYQHMQQEATSGKTGQAINSLNTVLNHINDARQNLPSNGSIPLLNSIENAGSRAVGGNPTGKFDVDASGIAGEFGKLVNGGVATQGELEHLTKLLDHNGSKKQISQALDEIENLAHGKLAGIHAQINSAMHPGRSNNVPSSLPSNAKDPLGIL